MFCCEWKYLLVCITTIYFWLNHRTRKTGRSECIMCCIEYFKYIFVPSNEKNDVDCIRQVCFFVKMQIMFNTRLWCRLFQFIHCVVWKMFKYFVHCTPELCKVQTEMQIQQYFRGIMEFNMVPTINFPIFLLPCQFKFYNALLTSYWQIILNLVLCTLCLT